MKYSKPEIVVIGDAAQVIQGFRDQGIEVPVDGHQSAADCEFGD